MEFERANAFWFRPRSRLIAGLLRRYLPEARSFYEAGCGAGVVLETLAREPQLERVVGRRRIAGRPEAERHARAQRRADPA